MLAQAEAKMGVLLDNDVVCIGDIKSCLLHVDGEVVIAGEIQKLILNSGLWGRGVIHFLEPFRNRDLR